MNFRVDLPKEKSSIIKVIGVGGGGSNAVNYMYNKGIVGVDFYVCNTDAQHLETSPVPNKILIGNMLTEGLGAGSDPEMGKRCAMESIDRIEDALRNNTKMVFITAGMGGGTGTGAAPVIAQKAREMGILTVGIVTKPFEDEGKIKTKLAEEGINTLKPHVDALLIVSNDRLIEIYPKLRASEGFAKADEVLCTGAKGIAEIITIKGQMNVDFNDVKKAMQNSGRAIMGTGTAKGDNRASQASRLAIDSPLLNDTSIKGAKHILVNISYGTEEPYMTEIKEITNFFQAESGNNSHLKFGITHNPDLDDELSITLIATGFESANTIFTIEEEITAETQIEEEEENIGTIEIDLGVENEVAREVVFRPRIFDTETQIQQEQKSFDPEDKDAPAYLRKNVKLTAELEDESVQVSKVYLEDPDNKKETKFKEGGNKYLHNNAD